MPIFWTDFHSNIHHDQMKDLDKWIAQIRETLDFWPIAYYPFGMRKDSTGLGVEDTIPMESIKVDWEVLREAVKKVNEEGFPMFMGYEWQGNGLDGDHNVFFKTNDEDPCFVLDYHNLIENYDGIEAIGIPHHTAYQLKNRGKDWDRQNDTFSPFAEIYSSHGSSECDDNWINMDRHVHMGPRTDATSVSTGLKKGNHFGLIASGDNHSCPGVYGFGYAAVVAKDNSKEEIWKALRQRHVYGVSKDRIDVDFKLDDAMMGDVTKAGKHTMHLHVEGMDTIDRIEILKNEKRIALIAGPDEEIPTGNEKIRYKFFMEAGWGPDLRVFPEFTERVWKGMIKTPGKILSVTPCFSTFGQSIDNKTDNELDFTLTTHSTTATGKWMGPSSVTTEGFQIEIEDTLDSYVDIEMEGKKVHLTVNELVQGTHVYSMDEEVQQLLKERYGFTEYYRSDPFWHNAYKFRVHKASLDSWYTQDVHMDMDLVDGDEIRCRILEKNGSCAWTSPIFIEE